MRDLWRRLEAYLKKHAALALDCLNPPVSEAEIREAQRELGVTFPADFAASLRIHDGQRLATGRPPHSLPFIPQEYDSRGVYRASFGELTSLPQIVEFTQRSREIVEQSKEWVEDYEIEGPIRPDGNWSWIVFSDAGSGDTLGLDLNPAKKGVIGQVISIVHDPACLLVLAPSFGSWFQALVARFESGRYYFEEVDGELEAVDSFRPDPTGGSEHDSDGDDGNILRFPR